MKNAKQTDKYLVSQVIPCIFTCASLVFLFFYLDASQEFSYYYREQQQIFLYDSSYIYGLLKPIGGFAVLLSQWLVQFFVLSHVGALVSTLLSAIITLFLWLSLRKNTDSAWLMPLTLIPAFFYNIYLLDNYIHYDGLIALLLCSLFLLIYTLLIGAHAVVRVSAASVLTLLLFYIAGSVAVLFALSILLMACLKRIDKCYLEIIPLALVLFAGLLAVTQGLLVDYPYAYGMKAYAEYYFETSSLYRWSWICVLLLVILFHFSTRVHIRKPWVAYGIAGLSALVICFGYSSLSSRHQDRSMYTLQRLIHYADNEQWDQMIADPELDNNNYLDLNYRNMALSVKGRLLDDLFVYPQADSKSLMASYQQYTDVSVLLARLYYHTGVIGSAQYLAFSSTVGITYGCPAMTKMLIKTYLINGTYKIAEKQINMLEKSWYYADWARSQRQFLYNDAAVEADAELGTKRRDLPDSDQFTMLYGAINDFQMILNANPDERNAADYAIAMLLLDKNMDGIKTFVELNYGKGYLKQLPERLQEAVIAYAEHDLDYCREHGVSEATIQKFAQFRNQVLNIRHGGGNLSRLATEYGRTFWYYMIK